MLVYTNEFIKSLGWPTTFVELALAFIFVKDSEFNSPQTCKSGEECNCGSTDMKLFKDLFLLPCVPLFPCKSSRVWVSVRFACYSDIEDLCF